MFKSPKKQFSRLKAGFGKIKEDTFDFFNIEKLFQLTDKTGFHQVISDRTFQDLDMDEIFMFIDRTTSKVGQQLLYVTLRTIPGNDMRTARSEELFKIFDKNPEVKEQVLHQLASLQSNNAYHILSLFLREHVKKPSWFWIVPLLSLASVASIILLFFYPPAFIALIILLAVNFGFHYWNKNNLHLYSGSVPQLSRLNAAARQISKLKDLGGAAPEIQRSIASIDSLGMQMSIFKLEAKLQSEIGQVVEYLLELIKALFLIEPLVLYHVLSELDQKRDEIRHIFNYVGEMDIALSIHFLRNDLSVYCLPQFETSQKQITAADVYHPLIDQSVANSISLFEKSALLTGSNMSGKTTFIRTIGINAILGQTIHTCFASSFAMPRLKVHSAIRMSDDLLSEKSYYFEEVLAIKALLEESRSGHANLFLLDEIFKGTNTVERVAAGKAVLEYLNGQKNLVFVATHDLEIAELLKGSYDAFHFTEIVQADDILFDYKIKPGVLTNTNAIRILELNGYPTEVTQEAFQLAGKFGNNNVTGTKL